MVIGIGVGLFCLNGLDLYIFGLLLIDNEYFILLVIVVVGSFFVYDVGMI